MSTPLIGITGFRGKPVPPLGRTFFELGEPYVRGIAAAGGLPVIIPPNLDERSLRGLYERLDGLLLSGGEDIDPGLFGQTPLPATGGISVERDRTELALVRWAVADDKPTLAICRGIQILNVALGGGLIQDIPTEAPSDVTHEPARTLPRDYIAHRVRVDAGTCLARILGAIEVTTNSWHHQSCREPGEGLIYTAWAPDGIVEGAEVPGRRFMLGVQWHPEEMFDKRADMLALFRAVVEAAR